MFRVGQAECLWTFKIFVCPTQHGSDRFCRIALALGGGLKDPAGFGDGRLLRGFRTTVVHETDFTQEFSVGPPFHKPGAVAQKRPMPAASEQAEP